MNKPINLVKAIILYFRIFLEHYIDIALLSIIITENVQNTF